MAKPAKHAAPARLESGWADLAEGRWAAARSAFEEALEDDETPEAWEGLSWAAWWLDDAEALFAARERAYRLYRKRGDAGGAARMATWLASDQLDFHGAAAVASGWLAPHRLLDPLEADAEALPFGDWEFDVVTSSFGAIFAPDTRRLPASSYACAGPAARSASSPSPPRDSQPTSSGFSHGTRRRLLQGLCPRSCGGARSTCASSSRGAWSRWI
ncbi:MAG TPA: hypothetical protein VE289_04085 [Gaiellaceae bacterium]|nr:hypothetical protein [Gaiellaceae bacterium]